MLKISNLNKFFGSNWVIKNTSFEVSKGEIVGLIGPSGSGKSVLLKLIGKIEEPSKGEIVFSEKSKTIKKSVGFLFQEGALFDSMSVIENVAFALRVNENEISFDQAISTSAEILKKVGLSKAINKLPGQLSGGMRKRAAIARALVAKPEIVLLDDPTAGLDPVSAKAIMNLINDLYHEYFPTVIIASHDLRRLIPAVKRLLVIFDGSIVTDTSISDLQKLESEKVVRFISSRYDLSNEAI